MKRWIIIALIALVTSILHLQVFFSSLGEKIEPWAIDLWFSLRGVDNPPDDIVVVAMDESSYSVLKLPMDQAWPRSVHAQLLRRLHEFGVKRVAMDILFIGASSNAQADQDLADAIKLSPTVIGMDAIVKQMGTAGGTFSMEERLEPYEPFMRNAETAALVKMTEENGYIRRFYVSRSVATRDTPTLVEAAAGFKANDPGLPGDRDFVRYYGPPGTIRTIPYHQALNPDGGIPKDFFKNKIVFIGLCLLSEVGPAQKDSFRTSFDAVRQMFGVEVQATAAANLLTGSWIKRSPKWVEGILFFFVTLSLVTLMLILKPQWGALVLGSSILLWLISSFAASLAGFFIPGVLLCGFFLPIVFLGSTLTYYLVTFRSQQQVEKAFQFYVSPEMAKQMRSNPNALSLGGESVYATAVFTDIAGFSEITENMNAGDVSNMLNAYFTEVTNEILEKKGTLIKFIGDAVFALWGAPIKANDHAKLAALSALAIHRSVERFNSTKKFPALHTRIGINTGPMLVGNLGSDRRFDYTAIGDSVNLASRVEGINKYFGTSILLTDSTKKELAGSGMKTIALGTICVAGKKERIGLNALLDSEIDAEVERQWLQALGAFKARKWDEASEIFQVVKNKEAFFAKAVSLYLSEIQRHKISGPDDDWQGEVEFVVK